MEVSWSLGIKNRRLQNRFSLKYKLIAFDARYSNYKSWLSKLTPADSAHTEYVAVRYIYFTFYASYL